MVNWHRILILSLGGTLRLDAMLQATVRNGGLRVNVEKAPGSLETIVSCDGSNVDQAGLFALREGLATPATIGDEIIEWLADDGATVICTVPRKVAVTHTLLHRGVGVIIYSHDRQSIFCHQRSNTKRVFPSMFDMLVGGVCSPLEPSIETLRRELFEEVNIDITRAAAGAVYLGSCRVQTSYNFCSVDCYSVQCTKEQELAIKFNDGEIQWGAFLKGPELEDTLKHKEFVPDGLQVWNWLSSKGGNLSPL